MISVPYALAITDLIRPDLIRPSVRLNEKHTSVYRGTGDPSPDLRFGINLADFISGISGISGASWRGAYEARATCETRSTLRIKAVEQLTGSPSGWTCLQHHERGMGEVRDWNQLPVSDRFEHRPLAILVETAGARRHEYVVVVGVDSAVQVEHDDRAFVGSSSQTQQVPVAHESTTPQPPSPPSYGHLFVRSALAVVEQVALIAGFQDRR